jgi:RNA polymerase sigma-70 factor (ECF subfamily)
LTSDSAAAEDIAQETLLRALIHLNELDVSRAWPWLRTVATNLVVDRHRRIGREVPVVTESRHLTVIDGDGGRDDPGMLSEALSVLPARQRTAVRLRYLEGWDASEVAALLGVNKGALKQVLFRARRRLAAEYERLFRELAGIALWPLTGLRRLFRGAQDTATRTARWAPASPVASLGATTLVCLSLVMGGGGVAPAAAARPAPAASQPSAVLVPATDRLPDLPARASGTVVGISSVSSPDHTKAAAHASVEPSGAAVPSEVAGILSDISDHVQGIVPTVQGLVGSATEAVGCAQGVVSGSRCRPDLPATAQGLAKGHDLPVKLPSVINDARASGPEEGL